jgi:hypothetical protein
MSGKKQHILVAFFGTQPVVNVQYVIIVIVIIAFVVSRLAWFSQDSPGIVRRFISELGIADVKGLKKIGCKLT